MRGLLCFRAFGFAGVDFKFVCVMGNFMRIRYYPNRRSFDVMTILFKEFSVLCYKKEFKVKGLVK